MEVSQFNQRHFICFVIAEAVTSAILCWQM
jgi:hypothetical protein